MEGLFELGNHECERCTGLWIGDLNCASLFPCSSNAPEFRSRWINGREDGIAENGTRKQFLLLGDWEGITTVNCQFLDKMQTPSGFLI